MRACNCARASPLQSRTRVGCDSMRNTFDIVSSQFQSTHPRGVRRLCGVQIHEVLLFQSTHPRGVRPGYAAVHLPRGEGFNPRTRVGCDLAELAEAQGISKFQSTHPRGVRLFPCFIQ